MILYSHTNVQGKFLKIHTNFFERMLIAALFKRYHQKVEATKSFVTPTDYSPPDLPVHGITQARILEWAAISYPRGFSWPRDLTHISCNSCFGRQILYHCTNWEASHPQKSTYHSISFIWISGAGKFRIQKTDCLELERAEKAMAPHSSTLAWKIAWMEEPGRLQSMGSRRVRHDWMTSLSRTGEGNGNPLQCSCLENPRDGQQQQQHFVKE